MTAPLAESRAEA